MIFSTCVVTNTGYQQEIMYFELSDPHKDNISVKRNFLKLFFPLYDNHIKSNDIM